MDYLKWVRDGKALGLVGRDLMTYFENTKREFLENEEREFQVEMAEWNKHSEIGDVTSVVADVGKTAVVEVEASCALSTEEETETFFVMDSQYSTIDDNCELNSNLEATEHNSEEIMETDGMYAADEYCEEQCCERNAEVTFIGDAKTNFSMRTANHRFEIIAPNVIGKMSKVGRVKEIGGNVDNSCKMKLAITQVVGYVGTLLLEIGLGIT